MIKFDMTPLQRLLHYWDDPFIRTKLVQKGSSYIMGGDVLACPSSSDNKQWHTSPETVLVSRQSDIDGLIELNGTWWWLWSEILTPTLGHL